MSLYDGVISVKDGEIGVIVAIDGDRVRLSAGGNEIGEWDVDDCLIQRVEDGVFSITAEEESLRFVPNEPTLFQRAVAAEQSNPEPAAPVVERIGSRSSLSDDDAPRLFLIVAGLVAGGLGIWALFAIF